MRVHDVEVLEFTVLDDDVSAILLDAQREAISRAVEVNEVSARHDAQRLRLQLGAEQDALELEFRRKRLELEAALGTMERATELAAAKELTQVIEQTIAGRALEHQAEIGRQSDMLELRTRELAARVDAATRHAQAFSPHLVEAIQRLGDEELLGRLSSNFSELAAVEGRGLLETARKFLDFVPASYLPQLGDAAE